MDKAVRAIDPKPDETFIEIGAGRGALTIPLARRARQVTAYEIDRDLAVMLRAIVPANVIVVHADFLATNEYPSVGVKGGIRIVGNLPYNVASPILFKLIQTSSDSPGAGASLIDATVMVQREVADRLGAEPGTRDYGVLSVLIGHRAAVDRMLNLPPGAFRPAPKVRSSLVRLRFHAPEPAVRNPQIFEAVVQAVFTRRRKTLANALLAYHGRRPPSAALESAGLDGRRRPETLTIEEFGRLADVYAAGRE